MTVTVKRAAVHEQDENGDFVETSPAVSVDYDVAERHIQPVKKSGLSSGVELDENGVLIHKWLVWFDDCRADVREKDSVTVDGMKYIVSGVDRFRRHKEVLLHGVE